MSLWGINVSVGVPQKRSTTGTFPLFYPCENASMLPTMLAVISDLAYETAPNAPALVYINNQRACAVEVSSSDPSTFDPVGVIVGVVVGVFVLVVLAAILYWKLKNRSELHNLPKAVNWSYKRYEEMPYSWTKRGTFPLPCHLHGILLPLPSCCLSHLSTYCLLSSHSCPAEDSSGRFFCALVPSGRN